MADVIWLPTDETSPELDLPKSLGTKQNES